MTLSAQGPAEVAELSDLLETLVQDNQLWIQRMRARGIEPPCCSKCGGVKYREPSRADYLAGAIVLKGAASLFHDHHGACGSIAAYDVAAAREIDGVHAWVEIQDGGGGPSSWHAVVGTPDGIHDPTLEMERG